MKRFAVWCILPALLFLYGCGLRPVQPEQTVSPTETTAVPVETAEMLETEPVETETIETTQPPETEMPEPEWDALTLAQSLPLETRVGQLFLARCPDTDGAAEAVRYQLGGYILFGRDFESRTPEQVRETIAGYQAGVTIPMLIAVDEEGGTVCRVSSQSQFRAQRFPSPRKLYDTGGMPLIRQMEAEKCRLLSGLGINVNMAPVCDITTDPAAFMYSRSLGQTPEETARFVRVVVRIMKTHAVGSVLKHFPGYGDNSDTHTGIAVDTRTLEELEQADLIPFAAGIQTGCGGILVSHTIVACLDDRYPASLSPEVHRYLREEMGFSGVIVTDDLIMDAISRQYGVEEAAVLAVLAGNDLLCSSDYAVQYEAVLEAVRSGRIPEELVNQAAARVLQWKYALGLLEEPMEFEQK